MRLVLYLVMQKVDFCSTYFVLTVNFLATLTGYIEIRLDPTASTKEIEGDFLTSCDAFSH